MTNETTTERVTTQMLRDMPVGQELKVQLPDAGAILNAKSLTYRTAHLLGCKFEVRTDYQKGELVITKKEKES